MFFSVVFKVHEQKALELFIFLHYPPGGVQELFLCTTSCWVLGAPNFLFGYWVLVCFVTYTT